MHFSVWRGISATSLLIWLWLALFRGRFWKLRERLGVSDSSIKALQITAVIPARDEAGFIERAVAALRSQRFAGTLRIVVADDESADRTAELAAGAGADRVISVPPRPSGWTGKLWAVASGIRAET